MNAFVTIKSSVDSTHLTFAEASGESFTATLESANFTGRVIVSTYHSGPPSLLFEEMARDWRGWDSKKEWAALEEELRMTASSDHTGHTALKVTMRNYCDPTDWRLEATLMLEGGQLEELARTTKKFFESVSI